MKTLLWLASVACAWVAWGADRFDAEVGFAVLGIMAAYSAIVGAMMED